MEIGILLLRLTVGLTLAAHGAQKVFGWFGGYGPDGTGQYLESLGFKPGRRYALAAGWTEILGGLLLAIGFITPLGASLGASVMLVAALTVHRQNGFFVTSNGYEYNLVLGVVALAVAFTGPAAFSVDHALGLSVSGVTWGVAAAAVAIIGALIQLALRRPATETTGSEAAAQSAH